MPNPAAIAYLQENKHLGREVLVEQLRQAGYPDPVIGKAVNAVFIVHNPPPPPPFNRAGSGLRSSMSEGFSMGQFLLGLIGAMVLLGILNFFGALVAIFIAFWARRENRSISIGIGVTLLGVLLLLFADEWYGF